MMRNALFLVTLLLAGCGQEVVASSLDGFAVDFATPAEDSAQPSDLTATMDSANADMLAVVACPVKSPPGYIPVPGSVPGVTVCRYDLMGGKQSFVVDVDLALAEVRSVNGGIVTPRVGVGQYGGNDPTITRVGVGNLWDAAVKQRPKTLHVFAAAFYNPANNPTQLAFAAKEEGKALSDGADLAGFPGQKWVLEVSNSSKSAQIVKFDEASPMAAAKQWNSIVANQSVDTALVGLDVTADKGPNKPDGRTFIGTNGSHIFVFISELETQGNADKTLRDFGAATTMMLGGGSSAQAIFKSNALVSTGTLVPHALAISTR